MLLHDARRAARFRDGELVLLADQDRSLWDAAQIADGRARARPRARAARPRPVRRAGGDRVAARRRAARLAADRGALRRARAAHRLAGRRAEPRRRGRRGRRARGRARDRRRPRRSTTTATCTRPAPSCCAASAGPTRPRDAYGRALELVHDDAERRLLERRLGGARRRAPSGVQPPVEERGRAGRPSGISA